MKTNKILIILLSLVSLISCDPPAYLNFYVKNNCNDTIEVKCETFTLKKESITVTVPPFETTNFLRDEALLWMSISKEDVNNILKKMEIRKNDSSMKSDPLENLDRWTFEKLSKDTYKFVLIIYPEDFE